MFGFRVRRDDALLALRAENSDLRQTLREEREAWTRERQELVDRIIALASPAALREARNRTLNVPSAGEVPVREYRPNFPGIEEGYRDPEPRKSEVLDALVESLRNESGQRQ